jgi:hypothetical protein
LLVTCAAAEHQQSRCNTAAPGVAMLCLGGLAAVQQQHSTRHPTALATWDTQNITTRHTT